MELRHLRYFIAVATQGSFNRAAQSLHLTQPALSRQVKDLEEELGVLLLIRRNNSIALTASGKRFYKDACEVLNRAELAVQRARGGLRSEVLKVGYAPSVTADILPRAMKRFHAEQPRVRIELTDLFPQDMTRMAENGELDVVITLEPSVLSIRNFHWEELRRIHLVLVMPAGHDLAKQKQIAPQSLCDVALVGLAPESFPDYVPHLKEILKPYGVKPRFVTLERDGVSTMLATLEAYSAAAIVAESSLEAMPRSLVCRPFKKPGFEPVIAMIGWSVVDAKPPVSWFARILQEEAAAARKKERVRRGMK